MRKLWSTITGAKEEPGASPRSQPSQVVQNAGKVEEVERRLRQLRATGVMLSQPPGIEAPRTAGRRPGGPRRGPEEGIPETTALTPFVDGDALEIQLDDAALSEEPPLLLTAEPDDAESDDARRFEHASQPPVKLRRLRLGEVLIGRKLITQEQIDQALATQRKTGERLGSALVSLGFITIESMVSALAEQLGVEVILQDKVEIDPSARDVLPVDVIRRHEVVPLWANDKVLRIAMADPTNLSIIDEIRVRSGRWVQVVLAAEATVRALIAGTFATSSLTSEIMTDEVPDLGVEQGALEAPVEDKPTVHELRHESTGLPIVNFVNFLLTDSVRRGASAVHVEPYENTFRVRVRVGDELQTIVAPQQRLHAPVISRIKGMSGMDISRRRGPQDGHLAVRYAGQVLTYRVSMLPTVYGEKAVMRLVTREADLADLARIGLPEAEERRLREAIAAPQGLVLVTGPSGSGKTTSVHAVLSAISDPSINVAALEDPVEVTLPGVTHVQVNERSGVTFADGLRSLLRQDPDVVFVGEMRDAEVSTLAVRASLTGQLVLSTLHANSALECLDRLGDLGVERYLVAAAIQTVVAQHLLRRVCEKCAESISVDQLAAADIPDLEAMLARMGELGLPLTFQRGAGCADCMKSGYKRRVGVFEVLPVDRHVRELIRRRAGTEELTAAISERGFRSLYENGLRLCSLGMTTLQEVGRVLGVSG